MTDYFIYSYDDDENVKSGKHVVTVLFFYQAKIKKSKIVQGLEKYNQENLLSDRFIVLLPNYIDEELELLFKGDVLETFQRVVGFDQTYSQENYSLYYYGLEGKMTKMFGALKGLKNRSSFFKKLFKEGNFHIFHTRGGLIESTSDHHFVFPSQKHSEKFIRTGNVLRDSNEIMFIALQLLDYFAKIHTVYCDTASINVLPFAVFDLMNKFGKSTSIQVRSFESYKVFENYNQQFEPNSLVLISSSTSGNIIDRLKQKQITEETTLIVLFFIGKNDSYLKHAKNIFCDVSQSDDFSKGYPIFETYPKGIPCVLCDKHSQPVIIQSEYSEESTPLIPDESTPV
jgi:hypothetical protein